MDGPSKSDKLKEYLNIAPAYLSVNCQPGIAVNPKSFRMYQYSLHHDIVFFLF